MLLKSAILFMNTCNYIEHLEFGNQLKYHRGGSRGGGGGGGGLGGQSLPGPPPF